MCMRNLLFFLSFTTALFASRVDVAAAANLSFVLQKLKDAYVQMHPAADIRFTTGSSGKLAIQIERGARYDIFLAANTEYTQRLYKEGKTLFAPKIYAEGALVLLSRQKGDFSKGMELLLQGAIRRVALANPKTAPYGKASVEALRKSGLYKKVERKIVYAESISQTLLYTLKAADAGLVAKSVLYAPGLEKFKEGENWMEIPPDLYTPISQAVVVLSSAKGNEEAKNFYNFLFTKAARDIFENHGYKVP